MTVMSDYRHPTDETARSIDEAIEMIYRAGKVCVILRWSDTDGDLTYVTVPKKEVLFRIGCRARSHPELAAPFVSLTHWFGDKKPTCYVGLR